MRIAEIFQSVQGEGRFAGTPSVFVRTSGCNLRCWFCDTPYTSWRPEGQQRPWRSVLEEVLGFDGTHVVVTGGEPLLQSDVAPLTRALSGKGKFVTLETAGTVYRPVHADLMSISPKLSNSTPRFPQAGIWAKRHETVRENIPIVARLMADYSYQLKFVVDQPEDVDEIDEYLRHFPDVPSDHVWLMPQGTTGEMLAERAVWLEPAAERRGYRYTSRLHIELFGNTRGT